MNVTKSRSFVKALTWRTTGTLDTFLISLLITKKPFIAASIASVEVLTKIVLYYFHERIWNKIQWGRTIAKKGKV
jgi:uncharacterized membrane protein